MACINVAHIIICDDVFCAFVRAKYILLNAKIRI